MTACFRVSVPMRACACASRDGNGGNAETRTLLRGIPRRARGNTAETKRIPAADRWSNQSCGRGISGEFPKLTRVEGSW